MPFTRQQVVLPGGVEYWTVVDEAFNVVEPLNAYLAHKRLVANASAGTTRQYASTFAEWRGWLAERGLRDDLMQWAEQLGRFKLHLTTTPIERRGRGQGRTRGEDRVGDMLAAIRSFFRWAVSADLVDERVNKTLYESVRPRGGYEWMETLPDQVMRPVHRVSRTELGAPVAISMGEMQLMLDAPGLLRDKLLVALIGLEGFRIQETVDLRRSAMHLSNNSSQLGCGISGPHIHVRGKGDKKRAVPAPPLVVTFYAAHLQERMALPAADASDFVLVNLNGGEIGAPMTTSSARRAIARLGRRACLDRHVTPHQFRHGLATRLVENGRPLDEVQKILGHASIETTRRYVTTSPERLRAAIESVPLPARSPR